jgi:hypothetical protein
MMFRWGVRFYLCLNVGLNLDVIMRTGWSSRRRNRMLLLCERQ